MLRDTPIPVDNPTIPLRSDVVNTSSENDSPQFNFETLSYQEILQAVNLRWNTYKMLRDQELSMLSTKRKELIPKRLWSAYVETLKGMSLKNLNIHLDAFEANGNKKPDHLPKKAVVDRSRTVVNIVSAKLVGDELTLEIRHYHEDQLYTNVLRVS